MKYVKQFSIIIAIAFVGELLHTFVPLPIPASIYGIVILFILLNLHIVKVSDVKETSAFLIEAMPLFFIPSSVGLIRSWGIVKSNVIPLAVITVVSFVLVFLVSGRVTQAIIRSKAKKEAKTDER